MRSQHNNIWFPPYYDVALLAANLMQTLLPIIQLNANLS